MRDRQIRIRGGWIPALGLLVACAPLPEIVTPAAEFRSGLPASIRRVETFGLWSAGERRGSLRLVVTRSCVSERCYDRGFLQWLDAVPDAQGRAVAAREGETAEIVELGDHVFVDGALPAPVVGSPGRFELRSSHSHTGEARPLCVTPGAPGSYRAEEGPCPPAGASGGG